MEQVISSIDKKTLPWRTFDRARSGGLALVMALTVVNAVAGSAKTADVAANAAWVVHMDWTRAQSTLLGKYLSEEMSKERHYKIFAPEDSALNLDPRKQVSDVTIYNQGSQPDDIVILMYGDFHPNARLSSERLRPFNYKSTHHREHLIHSWTETKKDGKKDKVVRMFASYHSNYLLITTKQLRTMIKALDVADRRAPAVSSKDVFAHLATDTNSYLIESAAKPDELKSSDSTFRAFVSAKLIRLQINEVDGLIKAALHCDVTDEGVSTRMLAGAKQLLGIALLATDKSGWGKVLDAISLKRDGTGFTASMSMPAKEFVAVLKASSEKNDKTEAAK